MARNDTQVHVSRAANKITVTLASPDGQVQFEIVLSPAEVIVLIDELERSVKYETRGG